MNLGKKHFFENDTIFQEKAKRPDLQKKEPALNKENTLERKLVIYAQRKVTLCCDAHASDFFLSLHTLANPLWVINL